MSIYSRVVDKSQSPQTEKSKDHQVKNNAGGYVYKVSPEDQFRRFLILGTQGGTFYVSERKLTTEALDQVCAFIKHNGKRAVDIIAEVSSKGKAPRNSPAIVALAMACRFGDLTTKALARAAIPVVCRTSTHLFEFMDIYQKAEGKWAYAMRRVISDFYRKDVDKVAYQMVKYRNRHNFTHRDVLRLCHVKPETEAHNDLFKWVVGKNDKCNHTLVQVFKELQIMSAHKSIAEMVRKHKLTWEMLPTHCMHSPQVWEALLENIGDTALLRNLGRLSSVGLLPEIGGRTTEVAQRLLKMAERDTRKIHPYQFLVAYVSYGFGQSKGNLNWIPSQIIMRHLEQAFFKSFGKVEPTGKNISIGLDVSGSMDTSIMGGPMTAMLAASAMSLITLRTEPGSICHAFSSTFQRMKLAHQSIDSMLNEIRRMHFGSTDCSLPILHATLNRLEVDAFIIYTDNETYHGNMKPCEALKQYRKKMKRDAKLIVVGMTSTGFSIADPEDKGCLDIVGFDASCPQLISDFIKGEI